MGIHHTIDACHRKCIQGIVLLFPDVVSILSPEPEYSQGIMRTMKQATIGSEAELARVIGADDWMMEVLAVAEGLALPDWWIGAGFLRNKVWNVIEGKDAEPTRDVDLVYFNAHDRQAETDWAYDQQLKAAYSFAEWEVRNQARMHYVNNLAPFISTEDGIAHWTETATCVAVKLEDSKLRFLFCYGTHDLFGLIARPTPYIVGTKLMHLFNDRLAKKQWREKWPDIRIEAS